MVTNEEVAGAMQVVTELVERGKIGWAEHSERAMAILSGKVESADREWAVKYLMKSKEESDWGAFYIGVLSD